MSWGIEPQGELADVFLATTDETGKQVSHPLGRYKGACTVITPAAEMNAITGVACRTGGDRHRAPRGGPGRRRTSSSSRSASIRACTPDPMAREEVTRVTVPLGAAIEAAP